MLLKWTVQPRVRTFCLLMTNCGTYIIIIIVIITSHGEDGSRHQGPLHPRNVPNTDRKMDRQSGRSNSSPGITTYMIIGYQSFHFRACNYGLTLSGGKQKRRNKRATRYFRMAHCSNWLPVMDGRHKPADVSEL